MGRSSFLVRYGTHLIVGAFGLTGPIGAIVGFFVSIFLAKGVDIGLIKIDITVDKLGQAMKDKRWRADALKFYNEAGARLYSEEEKNAIRKKYLDALDDFVGIGPGVSG